MKQIKCILLNYMAQLYFNKGDTAAAGKLVRHKVLCDSLRVSDNG